MNAELPIVETAETASEALTPKIDRRDFVTWAVAAPTAVAVGASLVTKDAAAAFDGSTPSEGAVKINNYLSITKDNKVQLTLPRVESGQGIFTSSAMLVADELGISMADMLVRGYDTSQQTEFSTTLQGGSGSTRSLTDSTRAAAAILKARLKAVGGGGAITTGANGPMVGTSTFASLAEAASKVTLAAKPYASAWKYSGINGGGGTGLLGKGMKLDKSATAISDNAVHVPGTAVPREDSDQIYTGTRKYTSDIEQDALVCLVMHGLQTRATPKSVNKAAILALPGVKGVEVINSGQNGFTLYTGVGIIADTLGKALDARDVIMKNNLITWNPGTASRFSTPMLKQKMMDATGLEAGLGNMLAAKQIKGNIFVHFHAQGTLGTQSAVTETFGPQGGAATGAKAWWGSQCPVFQRHQVAQQIGLDLTPTKVNIQITPDTSHFGRNLLVDSSAEATRVSNQLRQAGGLKNRKGDVTNKVKVVWSRNDDIRFAPYRPPSFSRYIASISANGKDILNLSHRFVSILCEIPSGFDNAQTEALLGATNQTGFDYFPLATPSPYTFTTTESFKEVVAPFPTGAMRAVYSLAAQGGKEHFIDEICRQTKQDRFDFRERYMKAPLIKNLLAELKPVWKEQAAAVDAWNANPNNTTFKGIGMGVHDEWGSASMQIVVSEIDRTADIKVTPPTVKEVWAAVDMGKITNPSGAAAMAEGATADAVAMVYYSKITFTDGAADQSTFLNYYWNRQRECAYKYNPVRLVNVNDNRVGGAGELSAPSSFGAVANAWAHLNAVMNPNLPSHYAQEFPIYGSPTAPLTDA